VESIPEIQYSAAQIRPVLSDQAFGEPLLVGQCKGLCVNFHAAKMVSMRNQAIPTHGTGTYGRHRVIRVAAPARIHREL
jgi:hypothetical protein